MAGPADFRVSETLRSGREVIVRALRPDDREKIASEIVAARGAALVPPFEHPDVVAGQGTVGLELAAAARARNLDIKSVYVPCSGGGLVAGCALALRAAYPECAVHAVEPSEMLKDPALEARAREVSKHLRCVVCQNETIDESDADIAKDMRLLLRTRILAGDSNEQVIQFLVSRYGDYVLLKPRFTARTYLLWFGPFIVLPLGAFVVYDRALAAEQTVSTAQ